MSLRNLLKSKFPADLNTVFFYLSRRVTFRAALIKALIFFYIKVLQSRKSSHDGEIFPNLSWMIYFHVRVISPVNVYVLRSNRAKE